MAYEQLSKTTEELARQVQDIPNWSEEAAPRSRSWRRGLIVGAIAFGGASALALKKASTPCLAASTINRDSIVSLAAVHTEDMAKYADSAEGLDSVKEWLHFATQAKSQLSGADMDHARQVIDEAMKEKDPAKAQKIVEEAMQRSLQGWDSKRQDLKSYLKSHARSLKSHKNRNAATTAECVFNVEQAVTQVAALAANIADSAKTCQELHHKDWKATTGKICVVNLAGIGYSVSMIAASLSLAAENCANTFFPNYDALCAGAATGLAAELSQFAGSAALTSAACMPDQLNSAEPGVVPSNWGQGRRLHDSVNATVPAQARRLVFGGGEGSTATQCYVDTTSVAWWLAQAGLAINAAANVKDRASCRIPPFFKDSKLHTYAEIVCAVDAIGAINGFLKVIQYLQLAVVHCGDQLNMQATCGAGIDGMIASLMGGTASSLGIYLNCWEAQGMEMGRNKALAKLHQAAMLTKINGMRQEGNFGRRLLEDTDAELAELKNKFATPEEAWRSMGIDLNDRDAAFRSATAGINEKDLVKLVETPRAERSSHMFEMCS